MDKLIAVMLNLRVKRSVISNDEHTVENNTACHISVIAILTINKPWGDAAGCYYTLNVQSPFLQSQNLLISLFKKIMVISKQFTFYVLSGYT